MVGLLRKQGIDLFGLDVKHYGPLIRNAVLEPAEEEPESWENITPLCGSIEACAFAVFFLSLYTDYDHILSKIQNTLNLGSAPC